MAHLKSRIQFSIVGTFLLLVSFTFGNAQEIIQETSEWKLLKVPRIIPSKKKRERINEEQTSVYEHPLIQLQLSKGVQPEQTFYMNPSEMNASQKQNGIPVQMGRNFEGNHLFGGTPADNAIAISKSGTIVSIDNATFAYFKENGDSVVQFGLTLANVLDTSGTLSNGGFFDPRVVYDSYNDRFIAVVDYHSADYSDSRLFICFSQPLTSDSVSWNCYNIHCDSVYTGTNDSLYWFDFPSIAINQNELFVTSNVFERVPGGGSTLQANLLLQIEKAGGYSGGALNAKNWNNIQDSEGNNRGTLIPLSDAFQSTNYDTGCYLVSNYAGASTKFFWYELTGDINDPNAQVLRHLTATSFYYDFPTYASQMGGNGGDRILFGSCKIHSGFHQNGKLHFVFHRSDNGWGEVVYANIDIGNNSFFSDTWGGDGTNMNYMYPSIAPFGSDSTEENFMIAFLRTGPSIFPEICAVNYDNGWSPSSKVVKAGLGVINLRTELAPPWDLDSLERWGDYTDIQRKFNSPQKACWLAGSYPFGDTLNFFGVRWGVNTWIAEIGDSNITSIDKPLAVHSFSLYPNPSDGSNITVRLPYKYDAGEYEVFTASGGLFLSQSFSGNNISFGNNFFEPGLYYLRIRSKHYEYETKKFVVFP